MYGKYKIIIASAFAGAIIYSKLANCCRSWREHCARREFLEQYYLESMSRLEEEADRAMNGDPARQEIP